MQKMCRQCQAVFAIDDSDLQFYDRVSPIVAGKKYAIPAPTLCPHCRLRARLVWRAEIHLFQRKSDASGVSMLSSLPPEAPCKVYSVPEWRSESWDPLSYGRPFDFSKPFFPQFQELLKVVPLPALSADNNENCDFVNCASWCKNCYLIAGANHNEDCYYGNFINHSQNCIDCSFVDHCELCYECIDCMQCYALQYSQDCANCRCSAFLFGCRNCTDCFGSLNLVGKQYVFFNEQLTKEIYEERLKNVQLHRRSRREEVKKIFETHRLKFPHRCMRGEMNEDVTGNNILRSKRANECFDVSDLEDCKYCTWFHNSKNCMDCYSWGFTAQESYSCLEVGQGSNHVLFSISTYNGADVMYCVHCRNGSQDVFGSVSLQRKRYCILNVQYTKEEYERLLKLIIEHMQKTGEWGEFFPPTLSPLAYNQTIAQDYMPYTKEQALAFGARWAEEQPNIPPSKPSSLPDDIHDCTETICKETQICAVTGKPYKIIPQELQFYREQNIPIPVKSFFARHQERLAKRNPRELWKRKCQKCAKDITSSYDPNRLEIVYCEKCYLDAIH